MKVNVAFAGTLNGHRGAIYKLFCLQGSDFLYSAGGDGWIVRWDKGEITDGFLVAKDTDSILTVHAMGKHRLLAGTLQGNLIDIKITENESQLPRKIKAHKKGVFSIISHGDYLFSSGGDGYIVKWDGNNLVKTHSVQLSHNNVRSLAFDTVLNRLWVGISSGKIIILDPDTLKIMHTIQSEHDKNIFRIVLEQDLAFIGGMDAQIRVLDRENFSSLSTIPAHWFTVNDLVIDTEKSLMFSASRDKTIRIWSLKDFQLLITIRDHGHSVNTLFWDSNKSILFSAGDDRLIKKNIITVI
jgi:WD40 repeat protein